MQHRDDSNRSNPVLIQSNGRERPMPPWTPYVAACCIVAAATIVGALLAEAFSTPVLFATYFAAVAIAGWYGGFGPGVLATLLAYVAANWFFVDPRDSFVPNATVAVFLFVCLAIAAFGEMAKRSARRARINAEHVKTLVESITDGFAVIDAAGRLTYMNPAAGELNRRHARQAASEDEVAIFSRTLGDRARAAMEHADEPRATAEIESYYQPWQRWFEVKASLADGGGLAIHFRDITERKASEEELRKLASIIESTEDAVIGVALDGTIASWNDAAAKLYGYEAAEILGRPVSVLSPPDQSRDEPGILDRIQQSETIHHYDTVRKGKDGRLLDVSLSVSPIKDSNGIVVGFSKIARDISVRKRAERALIEADRRKDDFLALLGHELRNPLAALVNSVQLLNCFEPAQPETVEVLEIIDRQATYMNRLIDDLLDVSRIVRGKIVLHRKPTDLTQLARQAIQDSGPLVQQKGIALEIDSPQEAIWVDGDAVRLAQILANLLNNAVKFSDSGGRVELRIFRDDARQQAIVEIQDTGIGMSPKTVASLFEPFAQAEDTLGRSGGGLGLGLAVVKGLVELHGGTIVAVSAGMGSGSLFTVRLPSGAAAPEMPAALVVDAVTTDRCRVLVIDDNADVALPLSRLLTREGHQVVVAKDGTSGVAQVHQFEPQIVLCDIGLPGELDGYGVARALRADPATKSILLVAVTGFGQEADRRRAAEAGFDMHLTKPIDRTRLASLLEKAAARPRDSAQTAEQV